MDNRTKYESNNDIEDILSETLSNGAGSPSTRVRKIGSNNHRDRNDGHIQERMELSSNKEVDVGLDLLVNKEKKAFREPHQTRPSNNVEVPNISSGFNLNNKANDNDLVNDMLSNLDLETTSKLSQRDIDQLIDEADKNSKLEQKSIIEENIGKPSIPSPPQQSDTISVLQSNYSRRRESLSPEAKRRKKQEILFKLEKMRRLGVAGIKKFNMSNNLADMQAELDRVKYERELESSIKFQRKCLMAFVTGSELLNNKFDFLDLKLDGWSEQVHDSIDEYNEVFEELHEKYRQKVKMSPEIRLLFMLGGSAFMYHLTNSMFKNSIPGMEDIMKQNPDLMKQFANAAINQMQGEEREAAEVFKNFTPMNNNGGMPQMRTPAPQANPFSSGTQSFAPPPRDFRDMPQKSRVKQSVTPTTGYVSTETSLPTPSRIAPPVGVDDILNELRSNTDNEVEDLLSQASSKKINTRRKKHKKKKKNIILNMN